jgi:Tfp pilus assembly protein PilN
MLSESKRRALALRLPGARRLRLGVTITPGRLVAVRGSGWPKLSRAEREGADPVWETEISGPAEDGSWPGLADAFAALREAFGERRIAARLCLAPPLAHAKVLRVPPVPISRLGQLVQRNARRYFAAGSGSLVVGSRPLGVAAGDGMQLVLAVAVAEHTLRGIVRAAETAEVEVEGITAASAAVARALRSTPALRGRQVGVVLHTAGWNEVVFLGGGTERLFHPLAARPADSVARVVVDALARSAATEPPWEGIALLCDGPTDSLARELAAAGAPGVIPLDRSGTDGSTPVVAAARQTLRDGDSLPQLRTPEMTEAWRRTDRRRTAALALASIPIFIAAAAVHLWGLQREIAAVEDRRSELAAEVSQATQARRATESLRGWLQTVASAEQHGAELRWSETIASLATALPDSAYLTTLTGDTATLHLAGLARNAPTVVDALQTTHPFTAASFSAPLQRDDLSGRERYEVTIPLSSAAARPQPVTPRGAP